MTAGAGEIADTDYGAAAEFYDLTGAAAWRRKQPALRAALVGARCDVGPVLDVGAGTGLSTAVIAAALPSARVLAAEPCAAMRVALATRVAADADLRSRVTIVADAAPEVDLPAALAGAACLGVVGHLTEAARLRLWATVAERLTPGAPLVVELLEETAPPLRGRIRIAHATAGDQDYEVWSRHVPTGPGEPRRWIFSYRVLAAGVLRREVTVPMAWLPLTAAGICAELAGFGLHGGKVAPDLVAVRAR